ncbi:putative LysE/RhtB family amino acid efflux pump [Rhizobium sp. RU33A]|uniref:LysE family transporter n=1 Tax=Rhizobium sp. RU33A TaxID=1907413 RepID=UPI00095735D8|nr:LysE family transporter [Rhizobium sp. RU33A]SIQ60789.1 putative LysE/RhtB family amino acid efflux pump [Rhizobium sp. RU33A]
MDALLFGKGLVLGVAIAAPLGPIGALCINRTLERGFWAGVAGGLGTAIADGVYATLAAAGFTALGSHLGWIVYPLQVAGGLFLIYLGIAGLKPRSEVSAATVQARGLLSTIAATFILTIANPATILTFAAIFAGLGLATGEGGSEGVLLVAGVFLGSLAWWFFLSGAVTVVRKRLSEGFAAQVSRVSAFILIAFGMLALLHAVLNAI